MHHLYRDGEQLTADVNGTHVYHTSITNDDGRVDGECNCPVGRDGDFCKHLVALGLTYLDRQKNAPTEKSRSVFSWKDFLMKCDRDELIKIILETSPNNSDARKSSWLPVYFDFIGAASHLNEKSEFPSDRFAILDLFIIL